MSSSDLASVGIVRCMGCAKIGASTIPIVVGTLVRLPRVDNLQLCERCVLAVTRAWVRR